MSLIIDGYNLLNAVGITGRGAGAGGLERSRRALLDFLAEALDPAELAQATIVFDARDPPPGLPRLVDHRGLTVRFAARYQDADTLIEELIHGDSAPRRLTVVSSDHRVQRAARRRRARAVDSDVWYVETIRGYRQRQSSADQVPVQPNVPLLEEDVGYWLRQFGGQALLEAWTAEQAARAESLAEPQKSATGTPAAPPEEIENPFPPGYGEDLLEEDQDEDAAHPFPPGYGEDLVEPD